MPQRRKKNISDKSLRFRGTFAILRYSYKYFPIIIFKSFLTFLGMNFLSVTIAYLKTSWQEQLFLSSKVGINPFRIFLAFWIFLDKLAIIISTVTASVDSCQQS